ncbi:hypothetical protein Tco_0212449 [Tanacetum coccineum]
MEVFIGGLPRSIEGNITASKPQTLEEAITITQRLIEQVIKHNSAQETNDHKRKFKDRRNTTDNNNYPNNHNNNNHSNNHNNYQNNHNNRNRNNDDHQQQNKRQETFRTYAATPTENKSRVALMARRLERGDGLGRRWSLDVVSRRSVVDRSRENGGDLVVVWGVVGGCLAEESSVITLDDVEIDPELTSREEPITILGRKSRQLRNKIISLVKVEWKHRKGTSIRWEPEEKMRIRYPHLFQE